MAAYRIARMLENAAPGPIEEPGTWLRLAQMWDIATREEAEWFHATGKLVYEYLHDCWVIRYAPHASPFRLCRVLIHELAHYLQRVASAWVLADLPVVYHNGCVITARHEIARRVERLVLG